MPERIQLSRRKGWRKPENTVVVARPSKWGNPFEIARDPDGRLSIRAFGMVAHALTMPEARRIAVEQFEKSMLPSQRRAARSELAGKNLACWCAPSDPCHADVLLIIANGGTS